MNKVNFDLSEAILERCSEVKSTSLFQNRLSVLSLKELEVKESCNIQETVWVEEAIKKLKHKLLTFQAIIGIFVSQLVLLDGNERHVINFKDMSVENMENVPGHLVPLLYWTDAFVNVFGGLITLPDHPGDSRGDLYPKKVFRQFRSQALYYFRENKNLIEKVVPNLEFKAMPLIQEELMQYGINIEYPFKSSLVMDNLYFVAKKHWMELDGRNARTLGEEELELGEKIKQFNRIMHKYIDLIGYVKGSSFVSFIQMFNPDSISVRDEDKAICLWQHESRAIYDCKMDWVQTREDEVEFIKEWIGKHKENIYFVIIQNPSPNFTNWETKCLKTHDLVYANNNEDAPTMFVCKDYNFSACNDL